MTASRKKEELQDMETKSKVVTVWIEALLKEKLPGPTLRESLMDGVVLCKLANVIKPGCIRKFHRRPKMLMMKMENIAFFLAVAKSRFSVPATVLFSPTDVHDDTEPTAMLKVLRVLLLLRQECLGDVQIDSDLLKALEDSEAAAAGEPEPQPEPPIEPQPDEEPQPPAEPTPEPTADEDPAVLEAERAAQEAAEAAQRALEVARAAQEKARKDAAERAEKLAQEKAAAEKAAAEKAAADKAAADAKAAADKAAADAKVAAAKAAADAKAAAATPKTAATTNGVSSASAAYLAGKSEGEGLQGQVLAEILSCIHSELTVESKQELQDALTSHVRGVQEKILYSSDKELRALCHEMGLGASLANVPENKERKFYVDWILKHGRITSS